MNINNIKRVSELNLERDSFISILSARRTGKSYLLSEMIYYFLTNPENKVDFLYVFSNTAGLSSGTNEQYDFIDKKSIVPAEPGIMNKVINGLMYSQKQTNFKFHILLVFDDIVISRKYEILELLASMGRHYKITTILSAQIANMAISPTIRNNTSYLFFRRLTNNSIRDNIYPLVGVAFDNARELIGFTNANIHDFQFIFYNNNKDFDKDSIQIVKADGVPEGFKYIVKFEEDKPAKTKIKDKFSGNRGLMKFDFNKL